MTAPLAFLALALAACSAPVPAPTPPPTPTLSALEVDGGSSGRVHLRGEAPGAVMVRLFASAGCHGVPLTLAEPAAFAAGTVVFAVPGPNVFTAQSVGPTGLPSGCSEPVSVRYVAGTIDAPTLTSVSPASPARVTSVVVTGVAGPGCEQVRFSTRSCGDGLLAPVPASELATGITVPLQQNAINWLTAQCFSEGAGWSWCSPSLPFVNGSAELPPPFLENLWPGSPASDPKPRALVSLTLATDVMLFADECDAGVLAWATGLPVIVGERSWASLAFAVPPLPEDGGVRFVPLYGRSGDVLGNTSACERLGTYLFDPSLPPRATVVHATVVGDQATLVLDAQEGATTEFYFSSHCQPPAAVIISSEEARAPVTITVPRNVDGGPLFFSERAVTDAGVSSCAELSF